MYRIGILLISAILLSRHGSGQDGREDYLKGLARMSEAKYPQAREYFSMAIEADPDNRLYYLGRAGCLIEMEEYSGALEDLALAGQTGDARGDFLVAKCYAGLDDVENCIRSLRSHLKSGHRLPEGVIRLDPAFSAMENNREWIRLWNEEWYEEEEIKTGEIRYLIKSGYYLDALDLLNEMIGKEGKSQYYALRARTYTELGNLKNAVSDYSRAIEGDNRNGEYYAGRASVYMRQGKAPPAIADYSRALELDPVRFDFYHERALAYKAASEYEKAVSDMEHLLRYFPDNPDCLYQTGMICLEGKKYIRALEILNKLLGIRQDSPRYFMARGRAYLETRFYEHAARDYSMALDLDPYNAESYFQKGLARYRMGDEEGACSDWQQALRYGSEKAGDLLDRNCR